MRSLVRLSAGIFLLAWPLHTGHAEDTIGDAVLVIRDVHQSYGGATTPLMVGDRLLQNQVISTATASQAKLQFNDRTELQIAPISSVKLDSFVYANSNGIKPIVFNATTGAFRFVSGIAHNYTVRTPTATLGVRGTAFAVRVLSDQTDVVLYNGEVSVCSRKTAACRELTGPCTYVTATARSVSRPLPVTERVWSFDRSCSPGAALNVSDDPPSSQSSPARTASAPTPAPTRAPTPAPARAPTRAPTSASTAPSAAKTNCRNDHDSDHQERSRSRPNSR
jgi:outer membrane immunogenic protein